MGGVDELLVVLVDMLFKRRGRLLANRLDLGLALKQFRPSHAFLYKILNIYEKRDDCRERGGSGSR